MATPAINSLGGANRLSDTWRYLFSCKTQIRNISRDLTSLIDSDTVLVTWEGQDTTGATAPKLDQRKIKPKVITNMRIQSVTQLKAIQVSKDSFVFPISTQTRLILDKSKKKSKEHELIYQQGIRYGEVGDCCTYLDDDDLLELERKGMIKINYKPKK